MTPILPGHKKAVTSVRYSPNGTIASTSEDKTVKVWDPKNGKCLQCFAHKTTLNSLAFNHDGTILAYGDELSFINIRQVRDGTHLTAFWHYIGRLHSLAFSMDSTMIISVSYDALIVWRIEDNEIILTREEPYYNINDLALSSDGQYVTLADSSGCLKVRDVNTGNPLQIIKTHTGGSSSVATSPDGKKIASANFDETIKVFDLRTNRCLTTCKGHTQYINCVMFSPDGQIIASASEDGTIKLWNIQGRLLRTLQGHIRPVNGICFCFDGRTIVSAGEDGRICLWEVETGNPLWCHKAK